MNRKTPAERQALWDRIYRLVFWTEKVPDLTDDDLERLARLLGVQAEEKTE